MELIKIGLLEFIKRSPSPYHAVDNVCAYLSENGYARLYEHERWDIKKGGKYYTVRGGSSVIAFEIPEDHIYEGIAVCASHTDSPSFKLKSDPELPSVNRLIRLNIEGYGGMAKDSWFDRPLSIAGRIVIDKGEGLEYRLVNVDRDLLMIPSLAVHMGAPRESGKVNIQTELLPVFREEDDNNRFVDLIAREADTEPEKILGCDLYIYNREKGTFFGADNEFFAAPRIDNLESVYASVKALVNSENSGMLKVFAAFNNEETGSLTRQGAESTFFSDVIERINEVFGITRSEYLACLASSFIMSVDNAHAAHPNYISKADPVNRPALNGGIVIKHNASGRYTTDAISAAAVKKICGYADIPFQEFHNRSDIAGGSTLGNLMNRKISVHSADIGLAQLAMHSAFETAGAKDFDYMERFLTEFYSVRISAGKDGLKIIKNI